MVYSANSNKYAFSKNSTNYNNISSYYSSGIVGWTWAFSHAILYYSLYSKIALSFSGLSGTGIGIFTQGISNN